MTRPGTLQIRPGGAWDEAMRARFPWLWAGDRVRRPEPEGESGESLVRLEDLRRPRGRMVGE